MNEYALKLVTQYRRKGIIVNTNILVMYIVGLVNRRFISQFKRSQDFTAEDFDLLTDVLDRFESVITTPNILTEVSNLLNQLPEHLKPAYYAVYAKTLGVFRETYVPSTDIATMVEFKRFGITDAGILRLAQGQYLVLTDDFRLSKYLEHHGVAVLNFNHLRLSNWKE